jgi:hypothetical protein
MKKLAVFLVLILFALGAPASAQFQRGDRTFRKIGIHRANQVRTVFGNWGVIAQPPTEGPPAAWKNDANGYIGDVSPMVGVEVPKYIDLNADSKVDTFHSVVVCPVARPGSAGGSLGDAPPGGGDVAWAFEPIPGFASPTLDERGKGVAMSHLPETWPAIWPDRPTWVDDRGRAVWNGYFGRGVRSADQESYWWMDDNNDKEFQAAPFSFLPDSTDKSRSGLAIQARIRGLQWSTFLAEDCIFWLYDFYNSGTTNYPKAAFGMIVGTWVGEGPGGSGNEWNDDVSLFDVQDDITYSWDYDNNIRATANPQWVGPVGYVGYAFLESPGNSVDGIDNDIDSRGGSPRFTQNDFGPRTLALSPGSNGNFPNNKVVLINKLTFERTVRDVPAQPTPVVSQGITYTIGPNVTLTELPNNLLDDDLDGLIDENIDVHYRQIRRDSRGTILIDRPAETYYKNYFSGAGVFDRLIDEDRDDGIDNDGDWNPEFDDVGADGVPNTRDFGENDGRPTAGEPNFDALDVEESDQIGLTSFEYFAPSNQVQTGNDENLWFRLKPGFFEVPNIFVGNRPTRGEDGDLLYGSGFFPLQAKKTQRFSMALLYGENFDELIRNKRTVQEIYNNNYTFSKPPELPTVKAVPGNRRVTLYWDRVAENSIDPTTRTKDFEGYKIYRATDPDFADARTITDGNGQAIFYKPIAQFDLKNGIRGFFKPGADLFDRVQGADFYLGEDNGLVHSFVDSSADIENGRRYYYALVAYDHGDEIKNIYPSETSKFVFRDATGAIITDKNTAVVVPNAPAAGYVAPPNSKPLEYASTTNKGEGIGKVFWSGLDQREIRDGVSYRVEFFDTSNDGLDNDEDWRSFDDKDNNGIRTPNEALNDDVGLDGKPETQDFGEGDGLPTPGVPGDPAKPGEPRVDLRDPEEFVPVTSLYTAHDTKGVAETIVAADTAKVPLGRRYLLANTIRLLNASGSVVPVADYIVDAERGLLRGARPGTLAKGQKYTISYQYYSVYRSPYILAKDSDIFDGVQLSFNNYSAIEVSEIKWNNPNGKEFRATVAPFLANISGATLRGLRYPNDYQMTFYDNKDISTYNLRLRLPNGTIITVPPLKVNFDIKNLSTGAPVNFIIEEVNPDGFISSGERVTLIEPSANDSVSFSWSVTFSRTDSSVVPKAGRTLTFKTLKPFRRGDVFAFEAAGPKIEAAAATSELERIKVVPNPYVVAATWEQPLPPTISSGRGERRIDFIHLPANAKIQIFTSRGEHVVTLLHDKTLDDGTVSWNLRTKENLDVAYGVYFYVVEAPDINGVKKGKLAIIK